MRCLLMILPNDKDLTLRYPLHTVDSSACLLRDTSADVMTFAFTNVLCHYISIVVPCGFSLHSFRSLFEYLHHTNITIRSDIPGLLDRWDNYSSHYKQLEARAKSRMMAHMKIGLTEPSGVIPSDLDINCLKERTPTKAVRRKFVMLFAGSMFLCKNSYGTRTRQKHTFLVIHTHGHNFPVFDMFQRSARNFRLRCIYSNSSDTEWLEQ